MKDNLQKTIRELIVANMFDGDDAGVITYMKISVLADDLSELITTWLIDGTGDYYE